MDQKLRISVNQLGTCPPKNLNKILKNTFDLSCRRQPRYEPSLLQSKFDEMTVLNATRKPLDRDLLREAHARDSQRFVRQSGDQWHRVDEKLGGLGLQSKMSIRELRQQVSEYL